MIQTEEDIQDDKTIICPHCETPEFRCSWGWGQKQNNHLWTKRLWNIVGRSLSFHIISFSLLTTDYAVSPFVCWIELWYQWLGLWPMQEHEEKRRKRWQTQALSVDKEAGWQLELKPWHIYLFIEFTYIWKVIPMSGWLVSSAMVALEKKWTWYIKLKSGSSLGQW